MEQKPEIIASGKLEPLNGKGRLLIFLLVLFGLGVTIYAEPLYKLFVSVLQRHGSSHSLFVPFISGYIIWLKIDKIREIKPQMTMVPGGMMVVAGLLIFYFCRNNTAISLPALSFLLVAVGLILIFFGWELFKEVSFPVFFLAAMIPLSDALYSQMAEWMRQTIIWPAAVLTKPLGIPIHLVGFDIYLPDIQLHVAHGCSGIRYLLSYFVFGIAYAFRFKSGGKARLLVVAATVPLAISGSVLRLWIIITTAYYIGPVMTEDRPHVLLSWSVFTVLLVVAIVLDRVFSKKVKRGKSGDAS